LIAVAVRDPQVRAAVADGIEDARAFWAQALYGINPADQPQARAVGSLHQALVSGVLVQWLIDPDRAPSPADLAAAMAAVAAQVTADAYGSPGRRAVRLALTSGSMGRCTTSYWYDGPSTSIGQAAVGRSA
jgi:hypothetical protein